MVIDTSALVAILEDEPERRAFNEALEAADFRLMSVATFVEVSIVVEARKGAEGLRELDLFIDRSGIAVVAVDLEQGRLARHAFSRFGKGRHPAGLNFGDCFSYALARTLGQPLLFKGTDFSRTDLVIHESRRSPKSDG
jgi:ribonuclease VapC